MARTISQQYSSLVKKEILMQAWKCFCEVGYAKTTIRTIAKEMGATTGIIYGHFKNKEQILFELKMFIREQNSIAHDHIKKDHTGISAILHSFRLVFNQNSLVEQAKNARGYVSLWDESLRNKKSRKAIEGLYSDFHVQIEGFLIEAKEKNEINCETDSEMLAYFYQTLFIGLQVQSVVQPQLNNIKFFEKMIGFIQNFNFKNGGNQNGQ